MKLEINILSKKFLVFLALIGIGYYLLFHFSIFPEVAVEVLRVNSPDGKLDAVYIQSDAGAMTSCNYLVYIVPKGEQDLDEIDRAVFWGKRTYDLRLWWGGDQKLGIGFDKSDIKHYQSYFYPFPEDLDYKVEIRFKQNLEAQ